MKKILKRISVNHKVNMCTHTQEPKADLNVQVNPVIENDDVKKSPKKGKSKKPVQEELKVVTSPIITVNDAEGNVIDVVKD